MGAIDEAAARTMAEAEGTTVEQCLQLPYPPACSELRERVKALGVSLPDDASRPECVFEIHRWCVVHRRHAMIQYLTDVEGQPWFARVEPHGFHRSREGHRLRCYLAARQDEPEVVMDFQASGWRLYLLEDIDSIEATDISFEPSAYRRTDDDVVMTISFRIEGAV